jgi:hypothetical protein
MGIVMVKCPVTRRAFSTGIEAEVSCFRSTPVFFGRSHCPHCRIEHEWFAGHAWVKESAEELKDGGGPPRPPMNKDCDRWNGINNNDG